MSNPNVPIAEAALAPQGLSGEALPQPLSLEAPASESSSDPSLPPTQVASRLPQSQWAPTLSASGRVQPFDVYEAEIFRFALANAGGCVSRAAEMLGVGRATMYRKMRAYEIIAPPVSERAIDRSRRSIVTSSSHEGPSPDSRAA